MEPRQKGKKAKTRRNRRGGGKESRSVRDEKIFRTHVILTSSKRTSNARHDVSFMSNEYQRSDEVIWPTTPPMKKKVDHAKKHGKQIATFRYGHVLGIFTTSCVQIYFMEGDPLHDAKETVDTLGKTECIRRKFHIH